MAGRKFSGHEGTPNAKSLGTQPPPENVARGRDVVGCWTDGGSVRSVYAPEPPLLFFSLDSSGFGVLRPSWAEPQVRLNGMSPVSGNFSPMFALRDAAAML